MGEFYEHRGKHLPKRISVDGIELELHIIDFQTGDYWSADSDSLKNMRDETRNTWLDPIYIVLEE